MAKTLFHGSNVVVKNPEIKIVGNYKDFGYGFYCTKLERQAQRWASTRGLEGAVSVYDYEEDKNLKILTFKSMTEEWLDFIVDCRMGKEHNYDIVEGAMADDQIWDYVEDFIEGNISREAFWVLVKFKHPTHQIVFCTQQALQCLTYKRSYKV